MSDLQRGPSFKPWKTRFLLDATYTGREVQTRRPLPNPPPGTHYTGGFLRRGGRSGAIAHNPGGDEFVATYANYSPGRCYVREQLESAVLQQWQAFAVYSATPGEPACIDGGRDMLPWEWENSTLPAIFMPRKAARLVINITSVGVERLGKISEEDAFAEGIAYHPEWDRPQEQSWSVDNIYAGFFNDVVLPEIYGPDLPEWWWVYKGEVLTRERGK